MIMLENTVFHTLALFVVVLKLRKAVRHFHDLMVLLAWVFCWLENQGATDITHPDDIQVRLTIHDAVILSMQVLYMDAMKREYGDPA